MPVPIALYYQACVYAIGEQAADIIRIEALGDGES
jgi:hypothetical protein